MVRSAQTHPARAAWLVGLAGLALVAGYGLAPERVAAWLYVAVGVFTLLALIAALAGGRSPDRNAWRLLVASQLLWVAGDLLYTLDRGTHALAARTPSPVNLCYLAGYPLLCAGLLRLRRWEGLAGAAELIDAAIGAIAIGMIAWVVVVVPVTSDPLASFSSQFVDIGDPLLDLLAFGLAVRLLLNGGWRNTAGRLIAGSLLLDLAADLHYGAGGLPSAGFVADLTNSAWLAGYILLAVAALHPSVRDLSRPAARASTRQRPARLVTLAALSVTGLAIAMLEALQGRTVGVVVLAGAAATLFLLATLRIGLLVRSLEAALDAVRLRDRALESSGSGIAIIDATVPNGRFLDVNAAFERISGYAREETIGRTVGMLFGEGTDAATASGLDLTLATGGSANAHLLGYRKNGEAFWSDFRLTPVADGSQRVTHMVGVVNDITEQVWSERELRVQAQLLDQAFAAVSATDTNGVVTHWNRHAEELYGLPRAQAVGRRVNELAIGPIDSATTAEIATALLAGERWEGEYRIARDDGGPRWVRASTSPVFDASGAIAGIVTVAADIERQKAVEAALAQKAHFDDLTGLPNRSLIADRLRQLAERAPGANRGSAVLFIDLDRFKSVNDHLGHGVGDELLRAAASRMGAALRGNDLLARFGGDEFVAVLDDVDTPTAVRVADRMREAMRQPFQLGGQELFIQASIGVAVPGAGQTASDLLSAADIALYRAKAAGRNRTILYQPGMEGYSANWFALESDLRRAIANGDELTVYYQPVVDLATGRVDCLEALVRWNHPERGLIPPGDFLPMAETTELIGAIGDWVLAEACRQVRAWADARPDLRMPIVNINVAARQLHEPDFVERVAEALAASWLRPDEIRLEITEQVVIEELRATSATLRGLENLGVRFAIDDFGAGASSLAALRELRADVLKLDRTFARDLSVDLGNRAIVRAVAALAHELGIFVTAEGLESIEQMHIARELGCDNGQGFLFAYPLPAVDVLPFLAGSAESGLLPGARPGDTVVPFRRRTG